MHHPLSALIVEDQALVAMALQMLVEDAGPRSFRLATDLDEASANRDYRPRSALLLPAVP